MLWLGAVLFYLYGIFTVVIFASVILLLIPFSKSSTRYQVGVVWCKLALWVLSKLCGVRYKVEGLHNIPSDHQTPLIVLGKHQSAWEAIAYPALFPNELCFVFKRELLLLPFFGWALGSLGMIHINRGDREKAREAVAKLGKQCLREGKWISIFPEGTRTPRGSLKPCRRGGVRLAISTDTNILPIAQNSGLLWPRNTFVKKPGLITVSIGPVITVAGKTEDQLQEEVENWIEGEMRRLDPRAY
ncbi:lysophospholipid acyltransferase family protein [Polynucleobacter necessarius]|uniref:lysophospholipid acyltransferase family protein n=1 Tax=Polynucleobacter necessarius TaxID=576610 RepID=UPI000E09B2C7|nr:lysophospholipid acyltransferase family protein [Polynucleobacter necessarius]